MRDICLIALNLTGSLPDVDADLIGADKGALILARMGRHMKLAVGDFDSVSEEELDQIRCYADETVILNPIKDDSDSEHAIKTAIERGYKHVILCGALGGRADHTLVNMRLVYKYPGIVSIMDENNVVFACREGNHVLKKDGMSYVSFFTLEEAVITLEGLYYRLTDRELTPLDLYTVSNEWTGDEAVLHVQKGTVLVIESRDHNNGNDQSKN